MASASGAEGIGRAGISKTGAIIMSWSEASGEDGMATSAVSGDWESSVASGAPKGSALRALEVEPALRLVSSAASTGSAASVIPATTASRSAGPSDSATWATSSGATETSAEAADCPVTPASNDAAISAPSRACCSALFWAISMRSSTTSGEPAVSAGAPSDESSCSEWSDEADCRREERRDARREVREGLTAAAGEPAEPAEPGEPAEMVE